jgi:hypothetical protein
MLGKFVKIEIGSLISRGMEMLYGSIMMMMMMMMMMGVSIETSNTPARCTGDLAERLQEF